MFDEEVMLECGFPPTVNNYYVKTRNGVFISQKGRRFRDHVADMVNAQLGGLELGEARLHVTVCLHPPDKRHRDLDNYMKALLDAITHTGLWEDDKQIDQLCIYRGEVVKSGSVRMEIAPAGPVLRLGVWPS